MPGRSTPTHRPPGTSVPEGDEAYFDDLDKGAERDAPRVFDSTLLAESVAELKKRPPLVMRPGVSPTEAVRAMQTERRGCVLVTKDGTQDSELIGIFTERDVLRKIVDRGRNPRDLRLEEVMTSDPEVLPEEASLAWVLNKMAVGGFRHVPIVDEQHRPLFVASVRDVVEYLVDFFPDEVLNLPPNFGPPRSDKKEGA